MEKEVVARKGGRPECVISVEGRWTNLDLWVACPAAWGTSAVVVTVYAKTRRARQLLGTIGLDEPSLTANSNNVTGLVFSLRGHACDGFEVYLTVGALADINDGPGAFVAHAWGDESDSPPTLTVGGVETPLAVTLAPSSALSSPADVAVGLVAVQLAARPAQRSVLVSALYSNTGTVRVGDSTVAFPGAGLGHGQELAAGDSVSFEVDDASLIWAIADAAAQGITVVVT